MNKAEKIVQIQKEVERLSLSARGIARGTALTPNTVLGVLRGEEKVQEATVNLIWFFSDWITTAHLPKSDNRCPHDLASSPPLLSLAACLGG